MTTEELGYDESALVRDLEAWWKDQVDADDPFAAPKPPAGTIFDAVPDIDSLGAVIGLVTLEKHVPFKVPVRVIRRGGYNGFDDLVNDLLPKLRALAKQHHDKQAAKAATKATAAAEAP